MGGGVEAFGPFERVAPEEDVKKEGDEFGGEAEGEVNKSLRGGLGVRF